MIKFIARGPIEQYKRIKSPSGVPTGWSLATQTVSAQEFGLDIIEDVP